jgi:aminocarboxymuconate-semialdehyde decarboxylase
MMRIDIHNHAVPDTVLEFFQREPVYGITVTGERHMSGGPEGEYELADEFCDADAKVANLEAAGLDAAIVSVDPPFFHYDVEAGAGAAIAEVINVGLREMCARRPDRLHWMATVPLQDPVWAAAMLAEQKDAGCVAVEVATSTPRHRLDDPELEPFWEAAAALDLPVMLHPAYHHGHPGFRDFHLGNAIGNLLETTIAIERLIMARVLDRYPQLRVVIVHSGGYVAYQQGRLRHARSVRSFASDAPMDPAAYFGQVRFDCLTHDRRALAFLIDRVGVDNMLMGTDLPCDMATPRPWDDLVAVAGEDQARQIAGDNAIDLFHLKVSAGSR